MNHVSYYTQRGNKRNISESAPHIASGRLRGIAVTSLARSDNLPDVPTIAEFGYPGFEALKLKIE